MANFLTLIVARHGGHIGGGRKYGGVYMGEGGDMSAAMMMGQFKLWPTSSL